MSQSHSSQNTQTWGNEKTVAHNSVAAWTNDFFTDIDPASISSFSKQCDNHNVSDFHVYVCNAGAEMLHVAQFDPGIGPIFLDKLLCSGSETTLLECRRFTPLGLTTCEHSQDAVVRCFGMTLAVIVWCVENLMICFYL